MNIIVIATIYSPEFTTNISEISIRNLKIKKWWKSKALLDFWSSLSIFGESVKKVWKMCRGHHLIVAIRVCCWCGHFWHQTTRRPTKPIHTASLALCVYSKLYSVKLFASNWNSFWVSALPLGQVCPVVSMVGRISLCTYVLCIFTMVSLGNGNIMGSRNNSRRRRWLAFYWR